MTPLHPKLRTTLLKDPAHIKEGLTSSLLIEYEGLVAQLYYIRTYSVQDLDDNVVRILEKNKSSKSVIDALKVIKKNKYNKHDLLEEIKKTIKDKKHEECKTIITKKIASSMPEELIKEIIGDDEFNKHETIIRKKIAASQTEMIEKIVKHGKFNKNEIDIQKNILSTRATELIKKYIGETDFKKKENEIQRTIKSNQTKLVQEIIAECEFSKHENTIRENIKPAQQDGQKDLINEINIFKTKYMPNFENVYKKWIKNQRASVTRSHHQLDPLKMDLGKFVLAIFFIGLVILLTFYTPPDGDKRPPGDFEPDSTNKKEQLLLDSVSTSFQGNDEKALLILLKKNKFEYRAVFHKTLLTAYYGQYNGAGRSLKSLLGVLSKTADIYKNNFDDPFLKKELVFYQALNQEEFGQKTNLEYLFQKAGKYSDAGIHDSARATLLGALEISRNIGDVKRETDIRDFLQYILYAGPSKVKALEAAKTIKDFANSVGYNFREEVACERITSSLMELGEYREARNYTERGIILAEQLGDATGLTSFYERLGEIETELGNFTNAVEAYQKSTVYNQKSKNADYESMIYNGLGTVYKRTGEYARAEEYLLKALDLSIQNKDAWNQAGILNNLADLFSLLNNYDKSNHYINLALSIAGSQNDDYLKADIKLSVGKLLKKQKKYNQARIHLKNALDAISHDNTKNYKPKRLESEILLNIADIYTLTKNFPSAIQSYEKSITLFKQTGVLGNIILAETRIADVFRKLKNYSKAMELLEKNIDLAKKINDPVPLAYVHYHKGITYYDQDNFKSAEKAFRIAIETVEKTRKKNISNEKILIDYFATSQDFYEKLILCLYEQGKYEQAYYYTELSKARVLLDFFQNHHELGNVDFPSYLEIQKVLGDDIQLIEYKITNNTLITFYIDQQKFECKKTKITRALLRNKVENFRKTIGADNNSEFTKKLRKDPSRVYSVFVEKSKQLYDLIISPVREYLVSDKIVYLITDDVLGNLPFAALVSKDGRFLIEDFVLASTPSASVLHFQLSKHKNTLNNNNFELFAIGNPTNDLPGSEEEVKAIASLFKKKEIITGKNVSKDRIRTAFSKKYNIYHFAMHAFVNEVEPLSSFLLLGTALLNNTISKEPAKKPYVVSEDYIFKASELYNYNLSNTSLVCLSACRTASGKHYGGEGILGLTYAFIRTGAESVITTHWDIQDKYSADIMTDFYDGWINNGMNKALALRESQLKTIKKMSQDKVVENPYPYAWASYKLTGMYN